MKKKFTLLLVSLFLFMGGAMAQMKVNGSIVSQSDGQPIIGATIMVSGTQIGTTSDLDGQFSLTVPEGKSTLKISYVGMETLEVSARPNMKIALTGGGNSLDEIIVTGYGVTRKAAFTGAATSVDTKTIANKTDANPIKALDGAVPGLHLTMESGQPGAPATIFIRGRNSLNSSTQPLYVVDGVNLRCACCQRCYRYHHQERQERKDEGKLQC